MCSPQTVRSGIAASNDDHVFIARVDPLAFRDRVTFVHAVLLSEIFHRRMDALQRAPRHCEFPGTLGTYAKPDGVEAFQESITGIIRPDMNACF